MTSLNDYRTFTVIVETLSITETANQLHKSVSAVSKQLSKLEASLGIQLIDRSTQSLTVTELGVRFYDSCIDILSAVEHAEQSIKDELIAVSGKLTISFPEMFLSTPFMDLIEAFCRKHPEVKFDFRISNAIDDVIGEDIDFAFRIGELGNSRLTALSLLKVHFILCATPTYIVKNGLPKQVRQLYTEDKLLLPTFVNLSEFVRRLLGNKEKLPFDLERCHTFNSEVALHQAVLKDFGVAMLLSAAVQKELADGSLVEVFANKIPPQEVFLIFNKRTYMPQKMKVFKDFIKNKFPSFLGAKIA